LWIAKAKRPENGTPVAYDQGAMLSSIATQPHMTILGFSKA
jgi:hypothetical protein